MDKRCKIAIFMGLTDPEGPHHKRQSMVLVPLDTPGVKVMRALNLFGRRAARARRSFVRERAFACVIYVT